MRGFNPYGSASGPSAGSGSMGARRLSHCWADARGWADGANAADGLLKTTPSGFRSGLKERDQAISGPPVPRRECRFKARVEDAELSRDASCRFDDDCWWPQRASV